MTSVAKDVKKHMLPIHPTAYIAGGDVKWYTYHRNSAAVSQKVKPP